MEIGSGLLHGFLDSCSLFNPFISTGSVVRFLYLFCFLLVHRLWSVFFPTHRDIVTSFLYGKSVVSPGWIGFGVIRLFC